VNPLLHTCPLELSDGGEDSGDEPPRRGACVDALTEGDERHSTRLPLIEQQDQVSKVPTQAI
jgi:hypothetical protein